MSGVRLAARELPGTGEMRGVQRFAAATAPASMSSTLNERKEAVRE